MTYDTLKTINAGLPMSQRNDWNVLINDSGITGFEVTLSNTTGSEKICRVNINTITYCEDFTGSALLEYPGRLPVNADL